MPVNTLKALKERRGKAVERMQAAHKTLQEKPADADSRKAFDEAGEEVRGLDQQIADEERMAKVLADAQQFGGPGNEDRTLDPNTEADDPIANLRSDRYSVLRVMDAVAEGRAINGYEGEIAQELEKRFGKKANGSLIPLNLRMGPGLSGRGTGAESRAALSTSTGAGAVPTILGPSLIEALRDRVVLPMLGAQVMSDMVGTFDIPKVTAIPTFSWVAEATAGSASDATIGKITFTPTTVTAWSTMTRRFMKQTSIDAELFARNQLLLSLARAMDYGGIAGSGASNQPTGLIYNTDTNLIALGTNGAALTWADIVEFESLVAADNADMNTMAYLFNAVTRGKLKTTEKSSGYPVFLWENGTTPVNGYAAAVSNQVPSNLTKGTASGICSAAVFGDFSQIIYALWGGADILVDPYTSGKAGDVLVICHQDMQVKNRHDEAFTRCVDILTA